MDKKNSNAIEKHLNLINYTSESVHSKIYITLSITCKLVYILLIAILTYLYLEQNKIISIISNSDISEVYIAQSPPIIENVLLFLFMTVFISYVGMIFLRKHLIVKYISTLRKENI